MVWVASCALVGNGLLTSPPRFSEEHLADTSLLKPLVDAMALGGRYPTTRGVEIRNLVFYTAAGLLAFLGGLALLFTESSRRRRMAPPWDMRGMAQGPVFWWVLLVAVSAISSSFCHAPSVCRGQMIIRLMHLAWWWPLAATLAVRQARALATVLVATLTTTAVIGLWYHLARVMPAFPSARLQYPIGNELWMAACLLPGVFVAAGLVVAPAQRNPDAPNTTAPSAVVRPWRNVARCSTLGLCLLVLLAALAMTRSRSAAAGLIAGLFTWVFFRLGRRRLPALLVMCLLGVAGAMFIQTWRATGLSSQRAHSIRARLEYEWPYALRLFFERPVGGYGDGAYSMLAGQLAREDQLDDPAIMRFDESNWPAHAHNEFLELAADLGLLGAGAWLAALALTLRGALRASDRLRVRPEHVAARWLIVALSSALVAGVVESCGTTALREPGLPPLFLTVWACLWVLVRHVSPVPSLEPRSARVGSLVAGLGCTVALLLALALGYFAVQDWRGARARFESTARMDDHAYQEAADSADFAAGHLLDPFQRNQARMIAVWARSLRFDALLVESEDPPTQAVLDIASDALARLNHLERDVPRFLRVSRLEAELALNRARAYQRRGETAKQIDDQQRFARALAESRADDPFLLDRVSRLWAVAQDARTLDKLLWLRCLLRNGEIDQDFLQFFRQLIQYPDFPLVIKDLAQVAEQDRSAEPRHWRDRLSPETIRMAALHEALLGRPDNAARLVAQSLPMYELAGPRLFAAHAAALHELVRYRFQAAPTDDPDANLDALAQARSLSDLPVEASAPLPGGLGQTRLAVLIAAGRDLAVAAQMVRLHGDGPEPSPDQAALAYLRVATPFISDGRHLDLALQWCERARAYDPELAGVPAALVVLYLRLDRSVEAIEEAERMLDLTEDRSGAAAFLRALAAQYAGSPVWAELGRRHPELGLAEATTQAAE